MVFEFLLYCRVGASLPQAPRPRARGIGAWAFALLGVMSCVANAKAEERIGLVLGGGGARGAAHVGVLKVLERERVPIHAIAGTSVGAAIGAFYAAGYDAAEIEAIVAAIDWQDMFRDVPPRRELPIRRKDEDLDLLANFSFGLGARGITLPRGALEGQKLLLLLRRLFLPVWKVDDFDALPVRFRAVATDIARGEAVVFDHGDLAIAVRASMSVPAAFAPIRVDGKLLVDGGISNNLPVEIARAMGVDRLIVVDVSAPLDPEENLDSPIAISAQMITALINRVTQAQIATLTARDLLIRPELGDLGSTAFERTMEAVPLGAAGAEAKLAELRSFSVGEEEYARFAARHQVHPVDAPLVEFLATRVDRSRTPDYVARRVSGHQGKPLDIDALEADIADAFGAGDYERITWELEERRGRTGVVVTPVDQSWGPNFLRLGLQLSDNFEGDSDYLLTAQTAFTGLNSKGAEWRNTLSLGRVTGLRSEFYQPVGDFGQYYGNAFLDYHAFNQAFRVDEAESAIYHLEAASVGLEAGWNPSNDWRVLGGIERGNDAATLRVGNPQFGNVGESFGGVYVGATRDTLDNAQFPTGGSRFDFRYEWYLDALGSRGEAEVAHLTWDKAFSHGKSNVLVGTRLASEVQGENLLRGSSLLGGFLDLSGFSERELFGEQLALGRAVYYRRLGDRSAIFSLPFYAGASLEAGNVWDAREDVSLDSLIYAGSIFVGLESFLGPIFLGIGRADTGDTSVYLSFRSLIRSERW